MSTTTEIWKHVGRTFALVAGVVVVLFALVAALFHLLPPRAAVIVAVPVVILILVLTIYHASRWSAYWAPIADSIDQIKWGDERGGKFVSRVELTNMQDGTSGMRTSVIRVSVYRVGSERRIRRTLIGDRATYLGHHGGGLWFYIENRFHARKDGLVCIDHRTCGTLFHRPRKDGELVEKVRERSPVVELEKDGGRVRIDLRNALGRSL